jgi:16S rRNA (cytosine1402-N4)-methyltransferase
MPEKSLYHESVLQKEVLSNFMTDKIKTVFDGTLGLGGHAKLILENFSNIEHYIATDLDPQHFDFATQKLAKFSLKLVLHNTNFSELGRHLESDNYAKPLAILLDLGLCSNQVDDETKGFSFIKDGPLNMSFGEETKNRAEEIINTYDLKPLTKILRDYGEEPAAFQIAKKIIKARIKQPIKTTQQFKEIIEKSVAFEKRRKAVMRVFQAIRIETNQELQHLEKALSEALRIMQSGDRIGIMSFHSLEDRIVKRFFNKAAKPKTEANAFSLHAEVETAKLKILTKKPIVPSDEELTQNPRSRSVKFRIAEKI